MTKGDSDPRMLELDDYLRKGMSLAEAIAAFN